MKEERRAGRIKDDGTFRVDSDKVINLREQMSMWVPEGSERFS